MGALGRNKYMLFFGDARKHLQEQKTWLTFSLPIEAGCCCENYHLLQPVDHQRNQRVEENGN